jgi:tetratricopeptide (TPR) repeat protein
MAKPMLVTLPLVLLLLDFWPLARFRAFPPARLLLEKAPLLALAAASAAVTLRAQAGALLPVEGLSLPARVANAAVSAVAYLGKMLWPSPLAVFYPREAGGPGPATVVAALLLLLLASVAAFRLARRAPFLAVGWPWYLVTLAPVIGIVQAGEQAMADRYTYLPSVGVGIAAAWSLSGLAHRRRALVAPLLALSAALLLAWGAVTVRTVALWRDGATLFGHAIAVTRDNWAAHYYLGGELARAGRVGEALPELERSVALRPDFPPARYNLALAYDRLGDSARAAAGYAELLRLEPGNAAAHNNLGVLLASAGDPAAAIPHFRAALQAKPDFADAAENLGRALAAAGPGR